MCFNQSRLTLEHRYPSQFYFYCRVLSVFDSFPVAFRQDLLVHEAHRHPYMERLSTMYMLKLRFPDFDTRAGSYWRLLFVLTLMPWMRQYRSAQPLDFLEHEMVEAEIEMEAAMDTETEKSVRRRENLRRLSHLQERRQSLRQLEIGREQYLEIENSALRHRVAQLKQRLRQVEGSTSLNMDSILELEAEED